MNALKSSNHRVLFQNADGNINMGLFCNDEDIDIYWLNCIAIDMECALLNNEELIRTDKESQTQSGYVELHRIGTFQKFL